ncbi:MAG TPA: NADH-quinone oxidoreductase subunit L, partial [Marmoricola sp.]|nr:NADH-quinone oxidoreductase subunit L [Marmoricola sp.]
HEHHPPIPAFAVSVIAVLVVAAGVGLAWVLVGKREVPRVAPQEVSPLVTPARNEFYADAFNDEVITRPGLKLIDGLTAFDDGVVDGAVEGGSAAVSGLADVSRRLQNGFVRSYALSLVGGAVIVLLALLAVNLG